MRTVRGFSRGGVAVEQRSPFTSKPIDNAFLPIHATVMLRESLASAEARAVVSIGQEVREGQLLAKSAGPGSSNVHSPIPGIVRRIGRIKAPGGYESGAIVVSLEGSFSSLGKRPERYLWKSLNKSDMNHIIQDKGLVRIATGEPLHEILSAWAGKPGYTLVVSALEMDPYGRTEEELLLARAEDVVDGCAILARMTQPARTVLAVDSQLPFATLKSLEASVASSGLELAIELFKRRMPQDMPGQIAAALGLGPEARPFVLEPSTLIALHDAIVSNKAHIEQYVCLAGGALKRPAVLKARVGTPIGDLIEECGGFSGQPDRIVVNGPFRGRAAPDLDTPVTRTTRTILALSREETRRATVRACVRCGSCARACPEGLDPHMLAKLVRADRLDAARAAGLGACTSCGACAYVCQSRIPLIELFDAAKGTGAES